MWAYSRKKRRIGDFAVWRGREGGNTGHRKTDGYFGSLPARKRGERYFDRGHRTDLFCRRAAEPWIAGARRWRRRVLASGGSGFRDFDRHWIRSSVVRRRRGGSRNDRGQFARRSQHRDLGVLCRRQRG